MLLFLEQIYISQNLALVVHQNIFLISQMLLFLEQIYISQNLAFVVHQNIFLKSQMLLFLEQISKYIFHLALSGHQKIYFLRKVSSVYNVIPVPKCEMRSPPKSPYMQMK